MSKLFSELTIRSVRFRNRIVVSPMCQYSSVDGFLNNWHLVHLGSRAVGGAALVIQEATAVSPEGRISYADAGIWKDEHIPFLKQITSFIHEQGAIAGIQLAHAGRKASTEEPWKGNKQITSGPQSWVPVAPSPVPFRETDRAPRELSQTEIEAVIDDFRKATLRSKEAGYKVLEIHAAHGYLLNQFLSATSNKRTDEYGGSFENRCRLLIRVVEEVRNAWPADLPLFVRLSATEWVEQGWSIDDSVNLASMLKSKGVDLIDASSGGNSAQQSIPLSPGYQVHLAEALRERSGLLTGAVGLITSARQAEEILEKEQADLVFLARELLRDPYFPLHAAVELDDPFNWPLQYERAKPRKAN